MAFRAIKIAAILAFLSSNAYSQSCDVVAQPVGDPSTYDSQVANRPSVSTPAINPLYSQFDSIAYAGALGLNQQGGLPTPCTTAPDAVSGQIVEYGDCVVRMDFYPDGVRAHGNGHLMIPQPHNWDRGEGTLVVVYEHIDGEAEPKSTHPDMFTFNNGAKASVFANKQYLFEARNEETARRLKMGGTSEGVNQLTWTNLPDNWDGNVHIEIVAWSQTDSYLMMDGVDYGSKGGLQNAGEVIPTVDNTSVQVVQRGTPRVKYIYSMMSRTFVPRDLAGQLSADLFDWAD